MPITMEITYSAWQETVKDLEQSMRRGAPHLPVPDQDTSHVAPTQKNARGRAAAGSNSNKTQFQTKLKSSTSLCLKKDTLATDMASSVVAASPHSSKSHWWCLLKWCSLYICIKALIFVSHLFTSIPKQPHSELRERLRCRRSRRCPHCNY